MNEFINLMGYRVCVDLIQSYERYGDNVIIVNMKHDQQKLCFTSEKERDKALHILDTFFEMKNPLGWKK